jgi:hypothetical protein
MVVIEFRWEGVTPEQYDAGKANADWVNNPNPHGLIHIAWFEGGALRCYDVWDSAENFNDFVQTRLMPSVADLGITTTPEVKIHPVHDTFVLERGLVNA